MFRETLNYDSFNKTYDVDISQALSVLSPADLEPSFLMFQPFIKFSFIYLWTSGPKTYSLESDNWNCIVHIPVESKPGVVSGSNSVLSYCITFMSVNCHFRL